MFRNVLHEADGQQQHEVEDENRQDEQRADTIGDGVAVRHKARTHEVPEVDGQGLAAGHDVRIEHMARYRRTCGEDEDCRLAEGTAGRQRDARDDARHGTRQHDFENRLQFRRAEGEARLFIRFRHRADGFLRDAHEHWQVQKDQGQRTA